MGLTAVKKPQKAPAGDLLARFVRGIERSLAELEGREREIVYVSESDVKKLKHFRTLLEALLKKRNASRKAERQSGSNLKKLVKNMKQPDIVSGRPGC